MFCFFIVNIALVQAPFDWCQFSLGFDRSGLLMEIGFSCWALAIAAGWCNRSHFFLLLTTKAIRQDIRIDRSEQGHHTLVFIIYVKIYTPLNLSRLLVWHTSQIYCEYSEWYWRHAPTFVSLTFNVHIELVFICRSWDALALLMVKRFFT